LISITFVAGASYIGDFTNWMKQHDKQYANRNEMALRYKYFGENMNRIKDLNAKYGNKTHFGLNKFADLSVSEFKKTHHNGKFVKKAEWPVATIKNVGTIPPTFDWRDKGAVTPVKDQGTCGCCFADSAAECIEGVNFLKTGKLVSLSVQNLVDCDRECMMYENEQSCDDGCDGGLMPNAFTYVITNGGIDSESSYPFEGYNDNCRYSNANKAATISNWTMIQSDENVMAQWLVANNPISIAVSAEEWQFYVGGVFYLPCTTDLDHGVLLVGYGTETTIFGEQMPYWTIKNSWGADWGDSGYIYLERGTDKCGVADFPCSAIA